VGSSLKQPFYKTFFRVTLPISLPAIFEISIYFFVNAMTTVSAVVFIYSFNTHLASVAVLNMDDQGDIAAAAAMGMMIFYTNLAVRVAYVLLNGNLWFKVPETLYFKISGKLPEHAMAKDLILKIIGDITTEGGAGYAMQFGGNGISDMSVESRLTLTNMTTEAGAKNGIIEPDQKVFDYLSERGVTEYDAVYDDDDAQYAKTYEYDVTELEPLVAKPFSPQNVSVVQETTGIELDKSYIGSCTGAKYEDLEAVAKILKGKKVKIRTEILPAAISIYKKATENGLTQIFIDAGAVVGPPTCGACCGAHMGVLAKDEVCVSTTNRNFPGRMGHVDSKTYLTSPLVAAASAVTGKLTDPRDL